MESQLRLKKIKDLWGESLATLSSSQYSVDQCIGFARQIEDGIDPYKEKRMSKAEELVEMLNTRTIESPFRQGDEYYFDLIQTGRINFTPDERKELTNYSFLTQPQGQ